MFLLCITSVFGCVFLLYIGIEGIAGQVLLRKPTSTPMSGTDICLLCCARVEIL